jgi:hypothetical protein
MCSNAEGDMNISSKREALVEATKQTDCDVVSKETQALPSDVPHDNLLRNNLQHVDETPLGIITSTFHTSLHHSLFCRINST